ncbi:MAG: bifunctional diguanylate cyclase/phosphodiesterase [Proteobacteria bacterium]|nr:bifunctional diguanylate cyclase/phosphodiesterase [Pseudomonadota bacterium]
MSDCIAIFLIASSILLLGLLGGFFFYKKLLVQSTYDAVTELPNRINFFNALTQHLLKYPTMPFAIIAIGIDRFPQINQALGYQIGDRLLNHVAQRLKANLNEASMIGRLASNVFIVLAPEVTNQNFKKYYEKIMEIFSQPFSVYTVNIDLDVLIGFSFYPTDGNAAAPLIQKADLALYAARHSVDRFECYQENKDPHHRNKISLMSELREGLTQNEFQIFYQPKVNLNKGHITQVEALIRWFHPTRGEMSPDSFIPLAEETGHLKNLTLWLLENGIKQCRLWEEQKLSLGVSINLSVKDLLNKKLPIYIGSLIKEHKLDPTLLTLEITESAFMREPHVAIDATRKLIQLGVNLSIDDFGTGYSSLSYLKKLPVNELKLDKSFTQDIVHTERVAQIVQSTIRMAHTLGMTVVAEGVSDEKTVNLLKHFSCDLGQGYYFSQPLSIKDFEAWLATSPWGKT